MIHNVDPRLSQWDVGRSVSISDSEATHIHFANQGDSKAVIIEIVNGSAKVPDYLLQTGKSVIAYAVKDGVTLESKSFAVRKRERPENYIYEDDQRNYIYALVANAETAVANASAATINANTAAERASLAATNANAATNIANEASNSANLAAQKANEAATKATNTAKSLMVIGGARGTAITIDNAIEQTLVGLRVFGKTTQAGMPTPDAPVELVSAGDSGSVGVSVAKKNLIAPNAITLINENRNLTCYKDKGLYLTSGTYTISIGKVCDGLYVYAHSDNTTVFVGYNRNAFTFTLSNPKRVWFNFFDADADLTSGLADTIQLEIGNTATAYEVYTGQSLTISTPNGLPGIPVTSGGNYTDASGQQWVCDEIDLARGVYVQRLYYGVVPNIGVTNEKTDPEYYECKIALSGVKLANAPVLSSHFATMANNRMVVGSNMLLYARFPVSAGIDTVEKAVNFFTTNTVSFIAVLLAPIETPLSEEELAAYAALHTYKNNTTVSNDAGAWMELEYVMDAKKYIDGLITGMIHPATVE